MPAVTMPAHKKGDYLVDYEEKVFEDVKAQPGEKALVTFHTVAFEGSIGLVNILQALRLQRKGFKTTILLYGPGVTLGVQRGFPKLGDEPFPGAQNFNNQLTKFMGEGGEVCLPVRAADALRSRRGVIDPRHPADQPSRRARSHPAAPARQFFHDSHVDGVSGQACPSLINVGWAKPRSKRAFTPVFDGLCAACPRSRFPHAPALPPGRTWARRRSRRP